MVKPVTNVTIVVGGTAGWMTALTLVTMLKWRPGRDDMKIMLIESPNVPTVGVGEVNVPSITMLLHQLDMPEKDFCARCNAKFKLGVLFSRWNQWEDGSTRDFFHRCTAHHHVNGVNPGYHFREYASGDRTDFCDSTLPVLSVAGRNLGPEKLGCGDYERDLRYAYYLDAGKLAEFLREISIERGVDHVRDDVVSVDNDERGFISNHNLERSGAHAVELVIDCTGFRSVLLGKELGEPFLSYDEFLLNQYNHAMETLQDEVRNFIVLYYWLNNRNEPFWKAARHDLPTPDSLAADFERWRHTLPNERDHPEAQLFPAVSNQMCLFGKGFYDVDSPPGAVPEILAERSLSLQVFTSAEEWSKFSEYLLAQKKMLVRALPDHPGLVTSIRGNADASMSALEPAMF